MESYRVVFSPEAETQLVTLYRWRAALFYGGKDFEAALQIDEP